MMIQLLGLSVVGAVLYALLKKESPAMAILFALALAIALLVTFSYYLQDAVAWLPVLQDSTGQEAFACLLKSAGIILCADYGRDLCKDAGSESMAGCISVMGRVMVLVAALPLLENVYYSILGFSQ